MTNPPKTAVDLAIASAGLSPCRSKRGVVVYHGEQLVACGFNRQVAPFTCDGSLTCKASCRVSAIHAEQAALLQAGIEAWGCDLVHVKAVAGELVPSGGPSCSQCSKLISAAGVVRVWLYHETGWRCYAAEEFHRLSVEAAA